MIHQCGLCFFAALTVLIARNAYAEITLHKLFADGAVLQQEMDVPIFGSAKDGEQITVEFQDQKLTTTAKDGRWRVTLKPLKAGGPFPLKVQGENAITVNNILVGEVWVCAGQSNMNMRLAQIDGGNEAAKASADPMLRLLSLPIVGAATPQHDFEAPLKWYECTPETSGSFSAVAYHFGKNLRASRKVPVGLIFGGNGSMSVQPLTPAAALEAVEKQDPSLRRYRTEIEKRITDYPEVLAKYEKDLPELTKKWEADVAAAKAAGKEPPRAPAPPEDWSKHVKQPSWLYNARIAALQPYAIRGVIYYQGESNVGTAYEYQPIFSALIRGWREDWGQGDFPFLFVQLSSMDSPAYGDSRWAELREGQLRTMQNVPRTAMVVSTDCGDCKDIHPRRKEPVGARLALAARGVAYGEDIVYSGPIFDSMKIESDRAILTFKHTGGGLVAKDGELKGFTLAGADHKFVPAKAEISGEQVIVTATSIKEPVAVRYGWADCPMEINLFNKEGLPASGFRTDDWPLTTRPK
jgi:sialate O-acetylesterase